LWVTRLSDEKGASLTDVFTNDWSPTWSSDGKKLYYVSNRGGSMDLWQQSMGRDGMPEGEPQPVTSGLVIRRAELSPDGTKLAYSKGRRIANIWRVPLLLDRPASWNDAEQVTFDQALIEFVDVSPDGLCLLFDSDRSGNGDIWLMDLADKGIVQVTRAPAGDFEPKFSPDGRSVAFASRRTGNHDLWVKGLDGGPARKLTQHEARDMHHNWSPDGQNLAFTSFRGDGATQVFVVPADGGEPRSVTAGSWSDWSPDGRSLVFFSRRYLYIIGADGSSRKQLIRGRTPSWSRDGERIYFKRDRENIWEVRPDGSGERQVTDLAGRRGRLGYEAPSTDGQYLYFIWAEELGDIWVMDVVTDESE